MTEQEAIKKLKDFKYLEYSNGIEFSSRAKEELDKAFDIAISALEKQINGGWIPVTYHETTDDDGIDKLLYPVCLDCHMPDDEEEIIVCTKKYVLTDICCHDDGYSLDSGKDWIDDIIAWQPLPEPYKSN